MFRAVLVGSSVDAAERRLGVEMCARVAGGQEGQSSARGERQKLIVCVQMRPASGVDGRGALRTVQRTFLAAIDVAVSTKRVLQLRTKGVQQYSK